MNKLLTPEVLTNAEVISFLFKVLTSPTAWLGLVIIIGGFYLIKIIYKLLEHILGSEDRKIKKLELENQKTLMSNDKHEKQKTFELLECTLSQMKEERELTDTVFKSLQINPSLHKYEILVESFLGTSQNFLDSIKAKLMYYMETEKKTSYQYIKKDAYDLFVLKVLNRLSYFTSKDQEFANEIASVCKDHLMKYLSEFDERCTTKDEAKQFLDDEHTGLLSVLHNVLHEFKMIYFTIYGNDPSTDYLKYGGE